MDRVSGIGIAAAGLLALAGALAAPERPLYDSGFFEPGEGVVTPHIRWAKPYAGGAPRVLFITHRNAMREVIELAQRLSMEYRVFATDGPDRFGETGIGVDASWRLIRGNSAEELAERLRGDLQRAYDVIVIGNVKWDELPLDCRYAILRQVKAGTGLVGSMPAGRDAYWQRILQENGSSIPETLAEGVPFKSLPAFADCPEESTFLRNTLQVAQFGRGRIGLVRYGVPFHQMMTPGPKGRLQDCRLDYDYYLALAIKLILWGARKEPEVKIAPASGPMLAGDRQTLARQPVPFEVSVARPVPQARLVFQVRHRRNRLWHQETRRLDLRQGPHEVRFSLPLLPQGSYFADLWVRQGEATLAFGSVGLEVTSPTHFRAVTLGAESFALGEPLRGRIQIENPVADGVVRLGARDLHGRLVAQRDFPGGRAESAFTLPLPPLLTLVGWLEAELRRGKEVLDGRVLDFSIHNLHPDRQDAMYVLWISYPDDFLGPLMAEQFTRHGIDATYTGGLGYGPYANQWWIPYATRFVDTKTDWYQPQPTRQPGDLVRDPCLTNPQYREEVRAQLTQVAQAGLKYGTSDFTLGDENHFVAGNWDLCFSDTCVADFRRWAQQEYGHLEKLNAEWGSHYQSWDEVRPATLEECRKTGNFVPWVDHRRHMESVWAGIHAFSREVIQQVVPQARVGYEGSDTEVGSFHANDYWKLAQAMNLNNIYYRDFLSLAVHDFAPPGMLLGGGWYGGYAGCRNEPFMRWFPWRTLFKGANSFWVWQGYGDAGSVMAFDLSLYPFFQAGCEEVGEIKAGVGKLLITAQRQHDGIALLWSASSVHVGTYTPGFPDMDSTLESLVRLLHDVGLECRIVSYAQLAAGQVTPEEFKVLLLPCAQALSEAEVEHIRKFAAAGGTVLADLRPGVADEHGKPYPQGPLDELFGIAQAPQFQRGEGPLDFRGAAETAGVPLRLENLICDASLRVQGGKALARIGDVPVLIVHRAGQGRTLLLNFSLSGYLSLPRPADVAFAGWAEGTPYRRFWQGLLQAAGIVAPVRVEPPAPQVEVSRFRSGQAEYVGLIQGLPWDPLRYTNREVEPPQPRPVTLQFGRQAHLYDVRAGRYLGSTQSLKTSLTAGIAKLYALLPYRVDRVSLTAAGQAVPAGKLTYRIAVRAGAPLGPHVVRVTVFGPEGKERKYYARNLLAPGGRATGDLVFALDDPAGTWKIVAKDVATGVSGRALVKLGRR